MITVKRVTDHAELEGILQLQKENLRKNIVPEEALSQGFVTAEYTIGFLEQMHQGCPSVIAKDGDRVVGYALATIRETGLAHDLLADLFTCIDTKTYRQILLKNTHYVVVGQLCVAKGYRGLGLVQQMYQHYKECLSGEFDYCITDVAQDNPRSLKAHIKSGFQVLDSLTYDGNGFDIVLWDWNT
jgi:ribosomal protein S18 acetylase RimI-like enzyme